MPKSRVRKRADGGASRPLPFAGRGDGGARRLNAILAAIALIAIAAGALWWWRSARSESQFRDLVATGQPALQGVETLPDLGRTHLAPGQPHTYDTPFPTSGPHDPTWTRPGFYEAPQRPTQIVHALEHGNIVIYYDRADDATLALIKEWTALYDGQWDGVVAVPDSSLGTTVVLTAWRKLLRLNAFDPAAAAAFIEAYRGRGPEHPVR